jgi:hypothetical protein
MKTKRSYEDYGRIFDYCYQRWLRSGAAWWWTLAERAYQRRTMVKWGLL